MLNYKGNYAELKEKMINKIKNFNIEYDDEDLDINQNLIHENLIKKNFNLPITYVKNKYIIKDNIISDLELSNNYNENLYNYVFNPSTEISKITTSLWNKHYTTDKIFLNDSKNLLGNYKPLPNNLLNEDLQTLTVRNKDIVDKTYNKWIELKNDTGFKEKYGFITWKYLELFNKSSVFLGASSLYNFLSPLLSLILPIIFLLIPFFILKSKGLKITLSHYIASLKKMGRSNTLLSLFEFNKHKWDKKIYLIGSVLFYMFQMYQNLLTCLRFYLNLSTIHNFISTLKEYLHISVQEINNYIHYSSKLVSYDSFTSQVNSHKQILVNTYDKIKNISPYKHSFKNAFELGYVLKMFYKICNNETIANSIYFLFGFNGYIENISNVQFNVNNNFMNYCKITNKKTTIKNGYYPTLIHNNPVKNNVLLKKNMIITGPNAAGKTTILKSTLFNIILSQQLCCGFYSDAKISPFNHIHCYLNIPDTSGRDSLFQAEARRCKEILDNISLTDSKETHFCIFDELFSGTNPYEAIGSAYSYLQYLTKFKNIKFMLTTHYITLCNKLQTNKLIGNHHMDTKLTDNNIIYHYKIKKGISNIKGGITVLQNLDYPLEIIEETKKVIKTLN